MKPDNTPVIAIGRRLGRRNVPRGFAGMFGTVVTVQRLTVAHRSGNGETQR